MSASRFVKTHKGFTLIELMIVISIIGLLSSIVLASLAGARDQARVAAAVQAADNNYHKLGVNVIANYNFSDTKDSSGNKFDLTLSNASIDTTTATPYQGNKSLKLNDITSYAKATPLNYTLIPSGSKGFTFSAWTKLALVNDPGYIISTSNFSVACNLGAIWIFSVNQGANPVCSDLTRWHQLTIVYDSVTQTTSVYTDGKLTSSGIPANPNNSTYVNGTETGIWIGCPGTCILSTNASFVGNIGDIKLFGESLLSSDVERLYAEDIKKDSDIVQR